LVRTPNRRDFLKTSLASLAGGLAVAPVGSLITHLAGTTPREYRGGNLADWEVVVGDGIYAASGEPPVSLEDIESQHLDGLTLLRANIRYRRIMAHNITFKRIQDDWAFEFAHTAGFRFRLPYLPTPDRLDLNAQSLEGCLFVWDGGHTRLDYGAGFQWLLNPWDARFGQVNRWSDTNGGEWVPTGYLPPDTEWHSLAIMVDYPTRMTAMWIDDRFYPVGFAATQKPDYWGSQTEARLAAEIISIYPEPGGLGSLHQAEFKDWFWSWEPSRPLRQFLPLSLKPG
jgi:hypothetical protein